MPATKENAPSRGTSSAEGNDQNPLKGTIEMNATSVPSTTDTALEEHVFDTESMFCRVERAQGDPFWMLNIDTPNTLSTVEEQVGNAHAIIAAAQTLIRLNAGAEEDTVIDARFAGGSIIVGHGHATHDPATRLVTIDAPGWEAALFAHESRALASALIAAADEADRQARHLRRPAAVDDHLRQLDD